MVFVLLYQFLKIRILTQAVKAPFVFLKNVTFSELRIAEALLTTSVNRSRDATIVDNKIKSYQGHVPNPAEFSFSKFRMNEQLNGSNWELETS